MDYNETDEKQPHLPKGASIPRNQVAGHKHEGRTKLGLLEHDDGFILKALQKPPRGRRELIFYDKIFDKDNEDKDVLQLRQFLPRFYGSHHFEEYQGVTYIKLENLMSKFRKPCVVDVKMGKKTYDPEAAPSKIAREMTKFPLVEKFGFQFTGMQSYNPVEQRTNFYDKFFCRKLGEDQVLLKGLGTYFNIRNGLRKDAISVLLEKLYVIEKWFRQQRKFAFYASSLLMVYEGDTQENDYFLPCNHCSQSDCRCSISGSEQTDNDNVSSAATNSTDLSSETTSSLQTDGTSLTTSSDDVSVNNVSSSQNSKFSSHNAIPADVRMIDFTHVFYVTEEDENYLFGLQNLIHYMELLLEMDV